MSTSQQQPLPWGPGQAWSGRAQGAPAPLIDQFEVLDELGRGGMGVVYRARDLRSGRDVALKVVLDHDTKPERLARLAREGKLTAALDHPGIVKIHGAGQFRGLPYLAYELVEGCRSLGELLDEGTLTLPHKVELIRDACRALGAAHAAGVIHRDIKPDNLLVDSSGRLKVADFGLATARDLERLTQTGAMVGTPNFMAPEQFETSLSDGPNPASDVWALGVVLYLALTDALPFEGATIFEVAARINAASPRRPRRANQEVGLDLEAVCLRALAKRPEDRYPSASALADDLDRALRGDSVEAVRHSELRGWARRAPWVLVPAVALVGLALAASYEPTSIQGGAGVAAAPTATPRGGAQARPAPPRTEDPREEERRAEDPRNIDGLFEAERPEDEVLKEMLKKGVDTFVEAKLDDDGERALYLLQRGRFLKRLNRAEANENFKEAAELGNGEAARLYAEALWEGKGCPIDQPAALRMFERGAENGDVTAMFAVGKYLILGSGGRRDPEPGYAWLLKAAEQGHRHAMAYVAKEHKRGRYLPYDLKEYEFWKQRAIEKGWRWTPDDEALIDR